MAQRRRCVITSAMWSGAMPNTSRSFRYLQYRQASGKFWGMPLAQKALPSVSAADSTSNKLKGSCFMTAQQGGTEALHPTGVTRRRGLPLGQRALTWWQSQR